MNEVFLKARELGEALVASEECKAMKQAEKTAMENPEAANIISLFLEKRQAVEGLLAQDNVDSEEIRKCSEEMDALQELLQKNADIAAMTKARNAFSSLLDQVNKVLRFMITGQINDDEDEEGCTGSCESCGGCGHQHLN